MGKVGLTRRTLLQGAVAAMIGSEAEAQVAITRRSLTGVWQGGVTTGGYTFVGEVIFKPDGTYQRMHAYGDLRHWTIGPYSIAQNWVHFEVDDYGPKYYLGVYQYPPPTETWVVSAFDGRTIEGTIGDAAWFRYRKAD